MAISAATIPSYEYNECDLYQFFKNWLDYFYLLSLILNSALMP